MNYFIGAVMVIGLVMMMNIDRFKAIENGAEPIIQNTQTQPTVVQEEELQLANSQVLANDSQNKRDVSKVKIFKCINLNGTVLYSESECQSNTVGNQIIVKPNVIDNSELRRQTANYKNQSQVTSSLITENITKDASSVMSPYDRDTRIRELNITINDDKTTHEKRADARNELAYLKNKNPKDLSYDLEQQRRNLKVDLTDLDSQKRSKALSALASIYTNYM